MRFTDALDRNLEEIQRPANPPVGNYVWTVSKHPENDSFESRASGKTFDRVTFMMSIIEAGEDVDPDDLERYGDVAGFQSSKTFLFDNGDEKAFERSLYNMKRFLEHLGIDADDKSLSDAMAESVGATCLAELKHRPDPNDPEVMYAEIGRSAAQ